MPKGTIINETQVELLLAKDLDIYERIVFQKIKIKLKKQDALVFYTTKTGGVNTLFEWINKKVKKKDQKMDKNKVPKFKWNSIKMIFKSRKSLKSNIFTIEFIISLLLAIMIITLLKFIID